MIFSDPIFYYVLYGPESNRQSSDVFYSERKAKQFVEQLRTEQKVNIEIEARV